MNVKKPSRSNCAKRWPSCPCSSMHYLSMSASSPTPLCQPSRPRLSDSSGINISDTQAITICSMPIDMLMESLDSLTWTVFSTSVLLVFAPSKPKMLLVATLLGQLNSPIKAYPSTSPFLAPARKILSIDFRLEPKSRRSSVTRCSKERSCGVLKIQLNETPMLMILGKLLNHGVSVSGPVVRPTDETRARCVTNGYLLIQHNHR